MTLLKKIPRFLLGTIIVLITGWSFIEIIYPWIKAFIPATIALPIRGLALCFFFVILFFYKEEDDIPPTRIETFFGIILMIGSIISATRIPLISPYLGLFIWTILFMILVFRQMKKMPK